MKGASKKLIGKTLPTPDAPRFYVVAQSLPGYGVDAKANADFRLGARWSSCAFRHSTPSEAGSSTEVGDVRGFRANATSVVHADGESIASNTCDNAPIIGLSPSLKANLIADARRFRRDGGVCSRPLLERWFDH